MKKVRFGIIGLGNMGSVHTQNFLSGKIHHAEITAVCDLKEDRLQWAKKVIGESVAVFTSAEEMLRSDTLDAVLIAVPHYFHPPYAILALENNIHPLVEKPAGVYALQVKEMNEAANQANHLKFGVMFNLRTNPIYQKARELVQANELGEIQRISWLVTDWYRTQSYYDSSEWRATWAGEGGGVLMNQSPHQLDLLQWICGMPSKITAFCKEGKYHDIEVEDDVTAYLEYPNGATGVFVTSTGNVPGTNRFEIMGDQGKLVIENDRMAFWKVREPVREHIKNSPHAFGTPEVWKCEIPIGRDNPQHVGIINNFIQSILYGEKLIANGQEGLFGVELANAMYLSSWLDCTVEIPVDSELYYRKLREKTNHSVRKENVREQVLNLDDSY
jgi:predicted dehydrogenase